MSRSVSDSPKDDLSAADINLVEEQVHEPFNPEFLVEDEVILSDAFTEDLCKELPPSKCLCKQVCQNKLF